MLYLCLIVNFFCSQNDRLCCCCCCCLWWKFSCGCLTDCQLHSGSVLSHFFLKSFGSLKDRRVPIMLSETLLLLPMLLVWLQCDEWILSLLESSHNWLFPGSEARSPIGQHQLHVTNYKVLFWVCMLQLQLFNWLDIFHFLFSHSIRE